jgi:pyruvate kinase
VEDVNKIALKKGYLKAGDMVISLAAMPIQEKGMVNTLRVTEVKENN